MRLKGIYLVLGGFWFNIKQIWNLMSNKYQYVGNTSKQDTG